MSKKIYAIGGGKDFTIYREMFELLGVKSPNLLLVPHAVPLERQQPNYDRMYNLLVRQFGCKMKLLKSDILSDSKKTKKMLDSSDIIYVSEGNTKSMIEMWKKYDFDELLREQGEKEKLLCGSSAGANCWFHSFTTEQENGKLISSEGLNFVNLYLTVHGQNCERYEFHKQALENCSKLGILLTNNSALEIVDNQYRIINSNEESSSFFSREEESYGIVSSFENKNYQEEKFYNTTDFQSFDKPFAYQLKK